MFPRVILIVPIGLVFLGIRISSCLGVEETVFLPQLTDVSNADNRADLRFMQEAIQQYAPTFNLERDSVMEEVKEEASVKKKRNVSVQGETTTNSTREIAVQKRDTEGVANSEDNLLQFPLDEDEETSRAINKRITQILKNPEDMGFKSRPGFRSWGGKRAKFVTWGGKRGKFTTWGGKRSKFNNWGGKRNGKFTSLDDKKNEADDFINMVYGQPRRVIMEDSDPEKWQEQKKDTFKSWGGKRGIVFVSPTQKAEFDSQSKFSNWGGKRFELDGYQPGKRDWEYTIPYEQETDVPDEYFTELWKRGEFQSWGGKRKRQSLWNEDRGKLLKSLGKRKFSSWAGKRIDKFEKNRTFGDRPEDAVNMNWLLRSYFNSILNLLRNDLRVGKKNVFDSSWSFDDDTDFNQFGFNAWKGRR